MNSTGMRLDSHALRSPHAALPSEVSQAYGSYIEDLIQHFCAKDDLATYDPYDIWNTSLGFKVKDLYNCRPKLGLLPAALLALFDDLVNERLRLFYTPAEYPIIRAFAGLCLVNLYNKNQDRDLLNHARAHLDWLLAHSSRGYHGLCWGLGRPNAVSKGLIYESFTPYSTMTPYALEAFIAFSQISGDGSFEPAITSILQFFEKDIQVMKEDELSLATSYTPLADRIVTNAVSYTMYAYALLLAYAPPKDKSRIEAKVRKLYTYICRKQRANGSWLYSPYGSSFIDCFHSCIILKNIIKTDRIVGLDRPEPVVAAGYAYIKNSFFDEAHLLFKRFSVANKPSLVRFDLYDNAEVLNLAILVGDKHLVPALLASTVRHFCRGLDVYSQIDFAGALRRRNTLRWAVMPFLYAASQCCQ